MKNENYDDNENSMTAEEFLDFMRKNRRTVPNEKRIANKDRLCHNKWLIFDEK